MHTGEPVVHEMTPSEHCGFGLFAHRFPDAQVTQVPLELQTWLAPQLVPVAFCVEFTHTGVPLEHCVVPLKQGLGLEVQAAPTVHAVQVPVELQTWVVPHDVPAGRSVAPSTQTGVPLAQLVVPSRHEFGFVLHACPTVHAAHVPALQTWLEPQLVPLGLSLASLHTGAPEPQAVVPFLHAAFGFVPHAAPAVHATHCWLALQTWFVPQLAPVAFAVPFTQTAVPVVHEVTPSKQAPGLPVHAWPAVQEPQLPTPSQTWPDPQPVPAVFGVPSTQVCAPVAHEVTPLRHALGFVVHAAPAVHDTQAPLPLQTWFVPQLVPAAFAAPFTQVCAPEAHDVTPSKHAGLGFEVHACPEVHATQDPVELHTWFVPQLVPVAFCVPSTQTCAPLAHEVTPLKQPAFGFVLQLAPAVHATHAPAPSHTWFVPQLEPAERLPESMQVDVPEAHDVAPVRQELGLPEHGWLGTHVMH
jgi:hypothetical protein